jgi:hypothetical protein
MKSSTDSYFFRVYIFLMLISSSNELGEYLAEENIILTLFDEISSKNLRNYSCS